MPSFTTTAFGNHKKFLSTPSSFSSLNFWRLPVVSGNSSSFVQEASAVADFPASQSLPASQFSWLYFLLLFSLIFFGIHVAFVSGECRTCRHDQMFLLMKLKNNLNVAAAENLVSWDPNTDGCSWRGVTCDANGHVIALDLSSHSISNGFNIPTTIFSLQHLQILNLPNNNFYSSQIPSGFHKLGNLTYLNLSNSGFSGQIPKAMANLTQLVILDFSHNNLSGKIPSSIGQLRQLELLDLSMNKLNGEIPTEITTLSFLRTMNLSFNQLVGRIPENAGFRKFSLPASQFSWLHKTTGIARNNWKPPEVERRKR